MVEALTKEEQQDFMAEIGRIGRTVTASMLEVRHVSRVSQLCRVDRIHLLAEMRKQPGLGKR